jgi:hypothetical protein
MPAIHADSSHAERTELHKMPFVDSSRATQKITIHQTGETT